MVFDRRTIRDFDWMLVLLAIGIVLFGTVQIRNAQPTEVYWQKQLIGLGIAIVTMLIVAFTDYRRLVHAAPVFYAFGLILLLLVITPLGVKVNGQQAWLKVPVIGQFQPSEFVKIPTVLMLVKHFGRVRTGPLELKETFIGLGILLLPIALIMLEPDAGQALTYFPLLAVVLFLSSIKVRFVIGILIIGIVAVPLMYSVGVKTGKIKPYQQKRIEAILDPESADPRGYGYHTIQSMVTVGKGGMTGAHGEDEYSQSRLKFLPEPHTDFIFAVTAENTGFIGSSLLLLAYGLLLSRLITDARRAPDRIGMLVIMAVVGGLIFSIFINIGMALGMLPVIGVPLPLMSAGLSSILSTFIAIGFALSVQLRRFVN